jgi:hypothetical protein
MQSRPLNNKFLMKQRWRQCRQKLTNWTVLDRLNKQMHFGACYLTKECSGGRDLHVCLMTAKGKNWLPLRGARKSPGPADEKRFIIFSGAGCCTRRPRHKKMEREKNQTTVIDWNSATLFDTLTDPHLDGGWKKVLQVPMDPPPRNTQDLTRTLSAVPSFLTSYLRDE